MALAAGARADDTLLLGFRATGNLDVEVRQGTGHAPPPDEGGDRGVNFPRNR